MDVRFNNGHGRPTSPMPINNTDLARRVLPRVTIGGHDATAALDPCLIGLSYTDNASGKADEIQIEVHDRDGRWAGGWMPQKGTVVTAEITCLNWFGPDTIATLPCGSFSVDEVDYSGPPGKVSIKAVSAALTSSLRETNQTRAWENYSLHGVANQIATSHDLTLMYNGPDFTFTRQDQREESDLAFVTRLARDRGLGVKVHDGKLVLSDLLTLDQQSGTLTIPRSGSMFSPKSWRFTLKSEGTAYNGCEVSYLDPETRELRSYRFQDPSTGAGEARKIVAVNQRIESEAEARDFAQKNLRNLNAGEATGSITIMGHPGLVAGKVITLTDFGLYDGDYMVETASHKTGGGAYETAADLRRTLTY